MYTLSLKDGHENHPIFWCLFQGPIWRRCLFLVCWIILIVLGTVAVTMDQRVENPQWIFDVGVVIAVWCLILCAAFLLGHDLYNRFCKHAFSNE